MNKKIGPLLLSGLIIGPILGSGVILLPPIAYSKLGPSSIWAWIAIMALGVIFAMIFAKLSVIYPGDGGMTIAIDKALGKTPKLYASLLMIASVTFGPAAVLLTASEYLNKLKILNSISLSVIALALVIISYLILQKDIKFISSVSFVLSSTIALVLVVSAIAVLTHNQINIEPVKTTEIKSFGKVVMILYWAIIGWEIIGNYSDQVKNIKRTMPLATVISLIVISFTYLIISLAMQAFPYRDGLSLVQILEPVFGGSSTVILSVLVTGLCLSTYLLIVGALARLVHSLSSEGYLPRIFLKKNRNNIPSHGVLYFSLAHSLLLILTYLDLIDIEGILVIANNFFLANALIGLLASVRIIKSPLYRAGGIFLTMSLLLLLSFSTIEGWIALVVIFAISVIMTRNKIHKSLNDTNSIKRLI